MKMLQKLVIALTPNPSIDKNISVEHLNIGGLNRVSNIQRVLGGKGINVAKILPSFGVRVLATGFMADHQALRLAQEFGGVGAMYDFVQIRGDLRVNLNIFSRDLKCITEINEIGFPVEGRHIEQLKAKFNSLLDGASIAMMGGSLPQGLGPDIYYELISTANEQGVKTILDASGKAFARGLEAKPFAIKPNIHELEQYLDCKIESEDEMIKAAKELLGRGIKVILLSLGGEGSMLFINNEIWRTPALKVVIQDTVGAGDSMVSALIYCLLNNKSSEEIAKYTSIAGSVSVSKGSGEFCTLREVEGKLSQITPKRIA